ncbi:MAG: hypothetical protein Q8911_10915 [Bacillota bacterium]|nr:hypothetical protein [Bacillota bacterium]
MNKNNVTFSTFPFGKVLSDFLVFESVSNGASNDLERATMLMKDYVGTYGMRENPLTNGQSGSKLL